jgi:hypothetical protein
MPSSTRSYSLTKASCFSGSMQAPLMPRRSFVTSLCMPTAQEAADLLTYITSSKFGDGTWKGKSHGFILHWQDKAQQYESTLPVKDHLTATIKRNLLENAAGQVHELCEVKAQAAPHKTQNSGIDLTYEQYCRLLSSSAQEYDGSLVRSVKTAPSAARRSIYYTKFEPREIDDEFFDVA